ncbi:NAD-dependent epimerase/dehydratase family protein [Micromonospora zhanjiangensis]|uniref:NAD-dependent epimerase/dehydratase family protein n=1 Tax=Micromonospora zhanjiangensis TaxID=1522057 RepID=A0ABV8KW30_9ACTN
MSRSVPELSGNVVITGANSVTGRELLRRLQGGPARTTALVRTPTELPAHRVIPNWTEEPAALDAIAGADAVIHLSGVFAAPDWKAYEEGTVTTTRRVVQALAGRDTRLVYFSYVDAAPDADNWYVRAKGLAEQELRAATNAVVFRIHPIVRGGASPAPFELMLRQRGPGVPVRVYGDGTQRSRPVALADVVTAAVAAAAGAGRPGTFDLGSPDELSVLEMVQLVNGAAVPVEKVSPEAAAAVPGPPPTVVDLLANLTPARDVQGTADAFGFDLTPVSTIWPLSAGH